MDGKNNIVINFALKETGPRQSNLANSILKLKALREEKNIKRYSGYAISNLENKEQTWFKIKNTLEKSDCNRYRSNKSIHHSKRDNKDSK